MIKIVRNYFKYLVWVVVISLVAALVIGALAKWLGWIFVPSGMPFKGTVRWTFSLLGVALALLWVRDVFFIRRSLRKAAIRLGIEFSLAVDAWVLDVDPDRYRSQKDFLQAYQVSLLTSRILSR